MVKQRAVVFDLDGTLVDAFEDITDAVNEPLRRRNMPLYTVERIRSMVGDGAGKLMERAYPLIPAEEQPAAHAEMLEYYRAHPADKARVYPGVFQALEALADWGVAMAILSNKPQAMTLSTCERLGLTSYFAEIQGENSPEVPRKPDPAGLQRILGRIKAERVLLAGDGVPDGEVAARAGIPFVACLWGTRTREELARLNPLAFAESPVGMERTLLNLLQ